MLPEFIDTITRANLTLPAAEVFLLIGLVTLTLLFRFSRCGIFIAYVFSYRWGWTTVATLPEQAQVLYVVFGLFAGALAVVGMLSDKE